MKAAAYPAFEQHCTLHEKLLARTRAIVRESSSQQDPYIALKFLKEWWLDHINKEDRKYAPFILRAP